MGAFEEVESEELRSAEFDFIDRTLVGDEKNKTLFDWSPEAIVIVNRKGVFIDANRKLYEWLAYKPEEIIGKHILEVPFLPQKTKEMIKENFARRMLGKDVAPYEVEFLHKNGTRKWGVIHGILLRDDANNVTLDLIMVSDITERKKALEELQQSEERFRTLFENTEDLIHRVNEGKCFVDVNPKWLEMLEYSRDEVKDLHISDILRQDQISRYNEIFDRVCQGEEIKNFETVFVSKTGKEIIVEGNIRGQFKEGKFIATVGIFRDITKKKKN